MTQLANGQSSVGRGRYLLGTELGRGGSAVVLRGWDSVLHRHVAVKLLRDLIMDPSAEARFAAEGKLLAALDHPGLITIFDAGVEDDRPFLVMEVVDGQTLARRLDSGPLPPADVATMGAALAGVLGHIHGHGVTHRDVKPSNVLIDSHDGFRLADFGIARYGDAARQTATGATIGTAAYLSPEQARGESGAPPSDIYALGLVLLEALTGEPAFAGPPQAATLARLLSPPHVPEELPAALRNLLSAMTASTPADRPSAAEVTTQLESYLASAGHAHPNRGLSAAPTPGRPAGTPADRGTAATTVPVPPRPGRRGRRVLAAAGGSVVLVAILLVASLVWGNNAERDAAPGTSPPAVTSSPSGPATTPVSNPAPSRKSVHVASRTIGSTAPHQSAGEKPGTEKSHSGKHRGHHKPKK